MERIAKKDNVIKFPVSSSVFEDAALWIARLDKGLDENEREQLVEWLQQHPDNAAALFELASFWDELDLLSGLAEFSPNVRHPRQSRSVGLGWRVAVVFLIAVFGLGLVAYMADFPDNSADVAQAGFVRTYSTEIGEQANESLPDGSSIILNTNTEVQIRYQEHDRIAELRRGEAHFTIAHDAERPFGVRAGEHMVQAVGTAFNVRIQEEGPVEVTVTDGIVRILDVEEQKESMDSEKDEDGDWWLHAVQRTGLVQGQAAILSESLPGASRIPEIIRLEPADLEMKLAWQSGVLVFEGETLAVVLDEFARYTPIVFMVGDSAVSEQRIGGIYEVGDTDNLLLSLKENFRIRAERLADDRILLLRDEE